MRTAVVGWKILLVIAAVVVLGVSSCPLRLIPSRLPNPFTFQREGVSEVAGRSPDRHLSISNHLPPSAPQVCQKRLQDRAPPFLFGYGRFSERERHRGQIPPPPLLFPSGNLFLAAPPPPFRILMSNSGRVRKGLEKPPLASVLWNDYVCVYLLCLLRLCCELPHGSV